MPTEVVMPRLSDTMETGTIGKWLKQEGEAVAKGEILAEIETDKANMEMESYANGILARILIGDGESAALGATIALIAANEDEAKTLQTGDTARPGGGAVSQPAQASTPNGKAAPEKSAPAEQTSPAADAAVPESGERIKASPLARRVAQEHGVELARITGTGPGGRITKDDVQSFLKAGRDGTPQTPETATPSTTTSAPVAAAPPVSPQPAGAAALRGAEPLEMTRMQQTIARRMAEAKYSAPDFVLTAEFDMTEARKLLKSFAAIEGAPKIGPNDFLIKAVASALRQHPEMNAGWENNTIVRYARINVGNAVAIPGGLVVPVLQDADKKSLGQIATESKGLIERARNNKLAPNEYEGGTFTVSNLGMFGIEQFTPIINVPEAAIMGVGSIVPRPVILDGEMVVRERMRVTISCDHRVVNGAEGAAFLKTLRGLVENPMLAVL